MDTESQAGLWALIITGGVFAAVGLFSMAFNIAAASNEAAFTAALGGFALGIGGALLLFAALWHGSERISPVGAVLVVAGSLLAGYSLGGGIDEIVRDNTGSALAAGMAVPVGAGLIAGGWLLNRRA